MSVNTIKNVEMAARCPVGSVVRVGSDVFMRVDNKIGLGGKYHNPRFPWVGVKSNGYVSMWGDEAVVYGELIYSPAPVYIYTLGDVVGVEDAKQCCPLGTVFRSTGDGRVFSLWNSSAGTAFVTPVDGVAVDHIPEKLKIVWMPEPDDSASS